MDPLMLFLDISYQKNEFSTKKKKRKQTNTDGSTNEKYPLNDLMFFFGIN